MMSLRGICRGAVVLSIVALCGVSTATRRIAAAPAVSRLTTVTIVGDSFQINGRPTLQGRTWRGYRVEGLLPNSRMVQATFDDLNADTRSRWAYPGTKTWDADRNTREFVAAMAEWRRLGLLAITINLQGGSPEGYSKGQPWLNSAFTSDGALRPDYARRLERVLDEADRLGMVVILGLFYFGQDQVLRDETAVIRGVDTAVAWVLERGYRNVMIEVDNECDGVTYDHDILKPARVPELIERVRRTTVDGRRLLVSTSFEGTKVPTAGVVRASDFVLLHGNGVSNPDRVVELVTQTRAVPGASGKPVIFNEDDHYDFEKPWNNMVAATSVRASWGFFDYRRQGEGFDEGYQSVPVNWGISSARKRGFFDLVAEMSGLKPSSEAKPARLVREGLTTPDGADSGATYRQLWPISKVIEAGAISPDGRYLSYADWDGRDLALHDFVTGADRRLTNNRTTDSWEYPQQSTISKDGKQVAYTWCKGQSYCELRIASIPASGFLQPRRVADSEAVGWIAPYDWSPDGKWIAVHFQRKNGTREIGLLSSQDGSSRVLKSVGGSPVKMSFSPDGKYLGVDFSVGNTNNRDVSVLAVDGSGEIKAVEHPAQDIMMGWSPDGKRLLFASDRTGSMGLWAVPIVEGKPAGPPQLIRPEISPQSLGVSTSGALYVMRTVGERDIYVASLDFNTGKLLSPPSRPVQSSIGSNRQPHWSPNGKYLAYVSERAGGERVLAIRSVETGQVREVRPRLREFSYFHWDPDGRSFVFEGRDFSDRQGVYRIDAASGEAAPIARSGPGGPFYASEPSPDGKKFYYLWVLSDADERVLLERDLASGSERELLRRKDLRDPSVSPDGRDIALRAGAQTVLLVPTAGGEPRELIRVAPPLGFSVFLAWAPDGRGIIVPARLDESGNKSLWLVPVGGGKPRRLDIDTRDLVDESRIAVHPDGRQIAYVAGASKNEVWVMESFLPGAGKVR